jgi:hypothetical protein
MIEKLANIDFYKNLYEVEISRKNEINGLVKFPTTLLSILIGAGFFLYKPLYENIEKAEKNCMFIIIAILSVLFAISITIAVTYLVKMFHNLFRKYYYLPSAISLKERQIELYNHGKQFYSETDNNEIEKLSIDYSTEEFNKDLLNYYIDNSAKNQKVNDNRYEDYYRSRHYLMISLIIIAISGILIIIKQ